MTKNILVVDDEGIITKTVSNLLKKEGYRTDTAESGSQAIEKVRIKDFDLIIADIKMPQINGVEAIQEIKKYIKKENKNDIPVVFITGYADSKAHIKAKRFGKVIFKPFDLKEFLTVVEKTIK